MTDKELYEAFTAMKLEINALKEGIYYLVRQVEKLQQFDPRVVQYKIFRLEETVDELVRNTPSFPVPYIFPRRRNYMLPVRNCGVSLGLRRPGIRLQRCLGGVIPQIRCGSI